MSRKVYESLVTAWVFIVALSGCSDGNDSARTEAESGQSPEISIPTIELNKPELEWVGQQVFRNECAGREVCLVHWNEGEAFPSLGIGHFIWYPSDVEGRFVESFPALIRYMAKHDAPLPRWLARLDPFDAPWSDRRAYLKAADSARVAELREFLLATRDLQAGFIVQRASDSLVRIVQAAPVSQRPRLRQRLEALTATAGGVYALIDYVNFKGEGLSSAERYNGEGWGLLQVLIAMENGDEPALARFRNAAAEVLVRRANNADAPIERERWLAGWLRRLQSYREPRHTLVAPK
jgi:hypothetical protein